MQDSCIDIRLFVQICVVDKKKLALVSDTIKVFTFRALTFNHEEGCHISRISGNAGEAYGDAREV
jgi:hypothetical protein